MAQKWAKIGPETRFFGIFSYFGSLFFLKITACNNAYHQVEVKPTKKFFGAQIWAKGAKISLETRFFATFSSLDYFVFLEIEYNNSLQLCIRSTKPWKKFWGTKFGPKQAKIRHKVRVFLPFSQVWFISFP